MLRYIMTCVLIVCTTVHAAEGDKPRVLVIGDSILSGYGGSLKSTVGDRATVIRGPGNASATAHALSKPPAPKKSKRSPSVHQQLMQLVWCLIRSITNNGSIII